DAIIDVEIIVRRLRQNRGEGSNKSTASIILEASLEVRSAIIYAVLIDVMVLLPVFFLGGVSGAFFQPLAISYALALLASMVVALTVTPALCLLLLRNVPLERRESPLLRWLQRGYEGLLSRLIRLLHPAFLAIGVLTTSAFTLVSLAMLPSFRGTPVLPSFKEPNVMIQWQAPPGTS